MFAKKMTFGAALALSLLTIGTAHAQTPTFGVDALASTSGYPGTYSDDPAALAGGQSISATADPAGVQFNNGYGLVYGDAAANATAQIHYLYGSSYAYADRQTATAFGNASPTANTESRYWDYITVRSNTLPNGTVVELVFRSALTTNWTASGVYSGNVYSELRVGGYSASTTSRMDSRWGTTEVPGPELRIKLTVGSRYSLSSKLRTYGRAYYFTQGPIYDGVINIETAAEVQMDPLGQDVYLDYDSDR